MSPGRTHRHGSRIARATVAGWTLLGAALGPAVGTGLRAEQEAGAAEAPHLAGQDVVVEALTTTVRFETDGTGERTETARMRIQSDAGVQAFGQLVFPYNAAEEELRVEYVRVTTRDGRTLEADSAGMRDMASPIALEAPIYSDQRNLHVSVPGLRPGATLEYRIVADRVSPLSPNDFWFEYQFTKDVVVLSERLEVELPSYARVRWVEGEVPEDRTESGRRHLTWERTQPDPRDVEELLAVEEALAADVQVSSFADWGAVAAWYAGLERDRLALDTSVREKATALTAELPEGLPQIDAIYRFVATEIRYVSLSFGLGAYQPHPAAEVLANGYGDCKDKHTLLAALLAAAGYEARPVFVSSLRAIDPEIASPGQFDHMISVVPTDDGLIWLDTTTELAPLGFLTANLRGQRGLVVHPDGAGELLEIPSEPPFVVENTFSFDGRVDRAGALTGKTRLGFRGDAELIMRVAFRRIPSSQRATLTSTLAVSLALPGTAEGLAFSTLEATERPFEISFDLVDPEYLNPDASAQTVPIPLGPMELPTTEGLDGELDLGGPFRSTSSMTIELPDGVSARAPLDVSLEREFATYRSEYRVDGHTLRGTRVLDVKVAEIRPSLHASYEAFRKAILSDERQRISLTRVVAAARLPSIEVRADKAEAEAPADTGSPVDIDAGLEVEALLASAEEAGLLADWEGAVRYLERALELDPARPGVRGQLAFAYAQQGQLEKAEARAREELSIEGSDPATGLVLGHVFLQAERYAEAIEAFEVYLEEEPLDAYGRSGLGAALVHSGHPAEGLPMIEEAATIMPNEPTIKTQLGFAYVAAGRYEEALGPLRAALASAPDDLQILSRLAGSLLLLERWSEAAPLAERLLASGWENPRGFEAFGRAVYEVRGLEDGTAYLGDLASRDPPNPRYVGAYAWLLAYTAQYDRALLWAREAARLDPDNGRFWALVGRMAMVAGRREEALAAYERTIELAPEAFQEDSTDRRNYQELTDPFDAALQPASDAAPATSV